jgi:hypothetical protein
MTFEVRGVVIVNELCIWEAFVAGLVGQASVANDDLVWYSTHRRLGFKIASWGGGLTTHKLVFVCVCALLSYLLLFNVLNSKLWVPVVVDLSTASEEPSLCLGTRKIFSFMTHWVATPHGRHSTAPQKV